MTRASFVFWLVLEKVSYRVNNGDRLFSSCSCLSTVSMSTKAEIKFLNILRTILDQYSFQPVTSSRFGDLCVTSVSIKWFISYHLTFTYNLVWPNSCLSTNQFVGKTFRLMSETYNICHYEWNYAFCQLNPREKRSRYVLYLMQFNSVCSRFSSST